MRHRPFRIAVLSLALLVATPAAIPPGHAADPSPRPLSRAHAHNDYEHARPLLDALDRGFCSVEADIHLVDGRLLVAHDRAHAKPERTLEALYLEPLRVRVQANGGRVHREGPPFWLLIDFKTEAAATWQALQPILERYRPMLTEFRSDRTVTNAVTLVLSGNSPRAQLAALPARLAAIDGRPEDLEANPGRHLVPWVSESWGKLFTWRGTGELPGAERERLRMFVSRAHDQGRRVRFWGTVDEAPLWRLQHEAGVDLINTDKLAELAAFLSAAGPAPNR
jgi:glycerophosphoryl diester phosphodiesterase